MNKPGRSTFLQVHDSGELSFQNPYDFQNPLVTPFAAESLYDRPALYRSTNDSNILEYVMGLISAANPHQITNLPAFALIVTWEHSITLDAYPQLVSFMYISL